MSAPPNSLFRIGGNAAVTVKVALTAKGFPEYHIPPILTATRLPMKLTAQQTPAPDPGRRLRAAPGGGLGVAVAARRPVRHGRQRELLDPGPGHRRGTALRVRRRAARVFRTPGYPMLLAPIFWLAGDGPTPCCWPGPRRRCWAPWPWRPFGGSRDCCSTTAPPLLAAALATFYPGAIVLERVDSQRGPVLPADAAATGPLDRGLAAPKRKRRRTFLAFAAGWRPGRPR